MIRVPYLYCGWKILCCNLLKFYYSLYTLVSDGGDLEWPSVACVYAGRHVDLNIITWFPEEQTLNPCYFMLSKYKLEFVIFLKPLYERKKQNTKFSLIWTAALNAPNNSGWPWMTFNRLLIFSFWCKLANWFYSIPTTWNWKTSAKC